MRPRNLCRDRSPGREARTLRPRPRPIVAVGRMSLDSNGALALRRGNERYQDRRLDGPRRVGFLASAHDSAFRKTYSGLPALLGQYLLAVSAGPMRLAQEVAQATGGARSGAGFPATGSYRLALACTRLSGAGALSAVSSSEARTSGA